jgi:hypothetical protein
MGISWPGADWAILVFMALFLAASLSVPLSLRKSP